MEYSKELEVQFGALENTYLQEKYTWEKKERALKNKLQKTWDDYVNMKCKEQLLFEEYTEVSDLTTLLTYVINTDNWVKNPANVYTQEWHTYECDCPDHGEDSRDFGKYDFISVDKKVSFSMCATCHEYSFMSDVYPMWGNDQYAMLADITNRQQRFEAVIPLVERLHQVKYPVKLEKKQGALLSQ